MVWTYSGWELRKYHEDEGSLLSCCQRKKSKKTTKEAAKQHQGR